MPMFSDIPLSLYVHIPWCVRKCPYCDFNSHTHTGPLPEARYVQALLNDLDRHLPLLNNRPLTSIFFGGGTPSLFSANAIENILEGIAQRFSNVHNIEITLEANPGTIDQHHFKDYRAAGINRLSLGIQSLTDQHLKTLGRIHDRQNALDAIHTVKKAGFDNFNLDIMFGLPQQRLEEALDDVKAAIDLHPTHFSWYQLTIEPNTFFYRYPPQLPTDDAIWEMQLAGLEYLANAGFKQYEVSAYAKPGKDCQHNRNYWEFGDYLGIGAGAHSKITLDSTVIRFAQVRQPKDYLDLKSSLPIKTLTPQDLALEFMLNALRLSGGISLQLFTQRTGLSVDSIEEPLHLAQKGGLLTRNGAEICPTHTGQRYLNELLMYFIPD